MGERVEVNGFVAEDLDIGARFLQPVTKAVSQLASDDPTTGTASS